MQKFSEFHVPHYEMNNCHHTTILDNHHSYFFPFINLIRITQKGLCYYATLSKEKARNKHMYNASHSFRDKCFLLE